MKNKTEIIYDAIQEIRTAVNAECIPIDELPKKVKELAEESANSGLTTAFVFSGTSNPNRPTANTLDLATGLVNDLDENWTQEGVNSNSVLMSFARFDTKGARLGEWSTPTNIKGAKGDPGVPGQEGVRGPQGLPGEKGEAGLSYRTVSVYTTTDSGHDVPATPKNGYWNIATNEITLPTTNVSGVSWKLSVNDFDNPKRHVWVSSVTFGEDGMPISKWSTPFRITGDDGKNGTDGRTIEFIYRQLPDYDAYISLWNHLGKKELPSVDEPNYVPNRNDDIVDTEWTDSPEGINSSMQFEVVCSRTRNSVEEPWGKWSNCAIWSKWGEDGMDGDGVEYIYLVTPAEINGVPTTSGHVKEIFVPEYSLEGAYQKDEFCFNDQWGFDGYDWTDEPRDVGRGEPMEWVMSRKYRNGRWERFSEPALWAKYSEDGVSYITSFVFTRAAITNSPNQPKGGDYYHAYPTIDESETGPRDENWHDSVPADGTLPVWMSTRTFCSDFRFNDDDWSEPKMLTDTPDFQVEYSAYEGEITREKISKFEGDSTEENEEKWRAYQLSTYDLTWGDDTKIKNPVWMITATRHGGKWSDWTISKIKGEKGDKGEAGSSVKIEGQFETLEQLKEAWEEYVTTGSLDKFHFESKDGTIDPGDGWYVKDDEKLYSYSGGWNEDEDDSRFETYWFGVHIKGEPGDSAYMYIAYCNEYNSNAEVDLIGPGKYIGVKATNKPLSETDKKTWGTYTWTKWEGEDGWGQEQIFLATSADLGFNPEKTHLPLPTENSQTVEFRPTHSYGSAAYPNDRWSDTPVTPTPDYPFCWVATRKCQGNTFGDWKGTNDEAALYSRWSYDGVNSVYVDLSNDLAIIPMEDGKVDPDFTDSVQTTVRVWVGDEQVPSTDFIVTGNNVTIDGATVTLDLSALNSNVKSIPLNVTLGGKPYDVEWKILQTDVAYELAPKTYAIKRYVTGNKAGQLELSELVVEIWKWSDNKWIASNIPLFAYITYTDGRDGEILSTSDGRVTITENGIARVNFDGLLNIASIKVYVVAKNEKGEYLSNSEDVLSFENIAVVADGKDGPRGEKGDAGTSVSIKGHFTYDQLIAADAYFANPIGTKPDPYFTDDTLVTGHCYVITSGTKNGEDLTGHMFIYDGSGDTFDERWADVGKLQGPAGQSQYLYIAFSDNDETVKILANGDIDHRGGKYIGYVVSNNVLNKDDLRKYKTYTSWSPWSGDDGWGWEQMFAATTDYVAPYFPSDENTLSESELIAKYGFSDKPISTDAITNKYIWYWTRKTNDAWQGASTVDGNVYAALYTRWAPDGQDGRGIISIEKLFAVNNDPANEPSDGWDAMDKSFTSNENRYLWCKETITYTEGDPQRNYYIVAVHGEPGATGTGNDAPLIYPAGVWREDKEYVSVSQDLENNIYGKVPYVFYATGDSNEGYYILKEGSTPPKGTVPTDTTYWEPIDSFEAVYSDIGLFNQALVGSLVFYGDWVFSQEGVANTYIGSTDGSVSYQPGDAVTYLNIIDAYNNPNVKLKQPTLFETFIRWFKPNFSLNAKTGVVKLNKLSINGTDTNGNATSTELTLNEVVEDIMGQEIVVRRVDNSQKPVVIGRDLLKGNWISATDVKDLVTDTIPRLMERANKIIIEARDVVANRGGSSTSENIDVIVDNLYSPKLPFMERMVTSTKKINYSVGASTYNLRAIPTHTTPYLNAISTVFTNCYNDSSRDGNFYPVYIGGKDEDVIQDPITGEDVDLIDDNGNKPTIGWIREQINAINPFIKFVEEVEEIVIGQRTKLTSGGLSYLKDAYSEFDTTINKGSIETGVVLAGTMAVTGDVTVGEATGKGIVAGIHNGSKILEGSNGDGLMIFAGAKGIETTTDTFIDGTDTKIITKVNNATTEIYSDGSVKLGNDISGIRIDAEGNVSMGCVDYDSFNAITEFKHNDTITITPFKPNVHINKMYLKDSLNGNVLNINIDYPENQNGVMKSLVVNDSYHEIRLIMKDYPDGFIMPGGTAQEFIIDSNHIRPVGGCDPYYRIKDWGVAFDTVGVRCPGNLYPIHIGARHYYFPILPMININGICEFYAAEGEQFYINVHQLSDIVIDWGVVDDIGKSSGTFTHTSPGDASCWIYRGLEKSNNAKDLYTNATLTFSYSKNATGIGFTLATNVRAWIDGPEAVQS